MSSRYWTIVINNPEGQLEPVADDWEAYGVRYLACSEEGIFPPKFKNSKIQKFKSWRHW